MVAQRPEQSERNQVTGSGDQAKPMTTESAGVSMTGREFNSTHKEMLASARQADTTSLILTNDSNQSSIPGNASSSKPDWQPSLKADPRHDWDKTDLAWTANASERLGFSDVGDNKTANAFRHLITSAVYTMKYGGSVASELGWMNEQKDFNIVSSLRGKIDLDKIADTMEDWPAKL